MFKRYHHMKKKKKLFTGKMNMELNKRIMKCFVRSVALYAAEMWTLTQTDRRRLEAFEMWIWRRMEKISWLNKVTSEKSAQRRRKHCTLCSKVEPKIFTPPQNPFPGARDGQNLISWRWSLPLPANPVW